MTEKGTRRTGTAVAVSVAALLPAIHYLGVLSGSQVFSGGEILYGHYPSLSFMFQALGAGQSFPEWAPGVAAGLPLAGTIEFSLFYPLNWLLYPMEDLYLGLNLLTVAHFCVASGLTALLARHWNASPAAAVVAGAVYSLNGFLGQNASQLMMLETICWLPLLLMLTDKIISERRITSTVAAGAVGGLALLGGMTQYAFCMALICGSFALVRCVRERQFGQRLLLHRFVLLLGAAILACCLFAVQSLPTLELLDETIRSEMSYEEALGPPHESLSSRELVGLVAPSAFGDRQYQDRIQGGYFSIYFGFLSLCLAVFAGVRVLPRSRFLWAVALLGFGVALGRHLPVFYLLYHSALPGVSLFKDPNRYVFLIYLPLALLAAGGLDACVERARSPDFWRLGAVRAAIAAWMLLWSAALLVSLYCYSITPAGALDRTAVVLELVLGAALPPAAVLACRRLSGKGWLSPARIVCAMALIEMLVICPATDELMPRTEWNSWSKLGGALPELKTHLPSDRRFYSDLTALTWNLALSHGLLGAPVKSALLPSRQITLTGLGRVPTPRDRFAFRDHLSSPKISRLLGVCCVVVHGPRPPWLGESFQPREQIGQLTVFRQEGAFGPLRLVAAATPVSSADQALQVVLSESYDPGRTTVIEGKTEGAERMDSGAVAPGRLSVEGWEPNTITAQIELERPAYLVHHQSYHPGWRAAIDGNAAALLRADYAFQAIRVPAGRHRVTFSFRSDAFHRGWLISAGTLLCMLALLAASRWRLIR